MRKLIKYMENFQPSRPIFTLQISDNGDRVDRYHAGGEYNAQHTPIAGDHLSELVSESYSENYDTRGRRYIFNKEDVAKRAMHTIRNRISQFVERNLEMRNPRQSKLYRWTYRGMPTNDNFNETLIMLYSYLRSFSSNDMRGYKTEHVKNGLAILEAMMEKYEK